MPILIEHILVVAAVLVLVSVLASKVSDRFGIPALLLFLLLGMLAGSDGPGGIYFDDPWLTQLMAVAALAFILFSGGLDTDWQSVRAVAGPSLALASIGVLLTALLLGLFASYLLGLPLLEGLLLAATVSSTDAAAVFAILRSKGISLKHPLRPLLELESGSNDPMAAFLTIGCIQLLTQPGLPGVTLIPLLVRQMALGAALGYGLGRGIVLLVNHLRLGFDGLYPVLTSAVVLLIYGVTTAVGGSGFLAVYVAGIVVSQHPLIHRRTLLSFHDGLAWLMQIVLFVTLGLLVFPSRLPGVAVSGLLLSTFLIVVARPVSVFVTLLPYRLSLRAKLLISWVGLRGAVPIVLATFPLLAGIPNAARHFDLVFFVVLVSTLLQGATIPTAARWLGVDAPIQSRRELPLHYVPVRGLKSELRELVVPPTSHAVGRAVVSLGLPPGFLIVMIGRGDEYIVSGGRTVIEGDDRLLVLAEADQFARVVPRWGWLEAHERPAEVRE